MTSVEACEALVESLLGGLDIKYIGHRSCIRKDISRTRKARDREESSVLVKRKAEVGVQEKVQLERATRSGSWLTVMPHQLNGMELSQEEF